MSHVPDAMGWSAEKGVDHHDMAEHFGRQRIRSLAESHGPISARQLARRRSHGSVPTVFLTLSSRFSLGALSSGFSAALPNPQ